MSSRTMQRFHPIIYVRGHARTASDVDQTAADPFCGFNLGSTVHRAQPDRELAPRKFFFESPLVRLASDFGYADVYEDGNDVMDPDWSVDASNRLLRQSLVVYRYYDESSRLLGSGQREGMAEFAAGLSRLIARIKALACAVPANGYQPETFRCHLVAHSMGGLVCRAFLQNPAFDVAGVKRHVDKFFTYATPHNGIEFAGINLPHWLDANDVHVFNRRIMAEYLCVQEAFRASGRVDWITGFPPRRIFCMVGTNRLDYEAAFGLSRTFVGHGSDGLVRIDNATLKGWGQEGEGEACAKAYAYRAHSGWFGIVNSEEAYQNLVRFLFGDVRVDVWMDVTRLDLPETVAVEAAKGARVDALYQFEFLAAPRGKLWFLSRRLAEEDSVACLTHQEWMANGGTPARLYLSSVFLANRARVNPHRRSLSYSASFKIRVPDYEIDRRLWLDQHYEGGFLFRDALVLDLTPPRQLGGSWQVRYGWQGSGHVAAEVTVDPTILSEQSVEIQIPFAAPGKPAVEGKVRLQISSWNADGQEAD